MTYLQTCRRHPAAGRFLRECSGCKQELFDLQTARERTTTPAPKPAPVVSPQQAHAVRNALAATPATQDTIRFHAERYAAQIDRRRLPVGCTAPIVSDLINRADAWRMHGRDFARLLGIGTHAHDPRLPVTARAVVAALDAPVKRLAEAAKVTGAPTLTAALYVAFGPAVLAKPTTTPAAPVPAPVVEPAYIPTRTGYRAVPTFPKTLAAAKTRLQTADDAFWAHSDHCDPCADAAWGDTKEWTMCGTGAQLWETYREAKYNVDNWRQEDAWHNRGGYERALENDWIAS